MHRKIMVQTVRSLTILAGEKTVMLEKPRARHRVFFSIQAFADLGAWYQSKISFDDPFFRSSYVLDGPARYFEAKGEDIFQGAVWVCNLSDTNLLYSATEILH